MPEALSPSEKRKLIGILARLGSDHDGERAAAGLLASRLLKGRGLTWSDIISPGPVLIEAPEAEPRPWKEEVQDCFRYRSILSEWEHRFLQNLLRCHTLTTAQRAKVQQIALQLRERRAA